MVLPGFADSIDLLGYLIERCPDCLQRGPFAVYDAKRKFTITFIPAATVGQRHIMECRTCGARFSLSREMRESLPERLLSQAQLSARVRDLAANRVPAAPRAPGRPGAVTAYQVLQVDPGAELDVIEAAFKRLALRYHPDRSTDPLAADRMRELIEARDLVSDPIRRRGYDASLGISRPSGPRTPGPPRTAAIRPEDV